MPLYDYKCRACSKVSEVRHGFREAYEGTCPACGGSMARVFNPAGILFKGSGFYLTDSRKAAPSEGSGAPASTTTTPAASTTTPAPAAPASSGDSGSSKKSESSAA